MKQLHEKTFAIAWGDMDALGHVNNGKYFDYFQEARIEWLAALQLDMKQSKGPLVVHIAATFLKPVVYPATLTLKTYVEAIGNASLTLKHALFQGETLMTEGVCKIVWADYTLGKSIPLPQEIRKKLS